MKAAVRARINQARSRAESIARIDTALLHWQIPPVGEDECVYFMRSTGGGPIKIGYTSRDLNRRKYELEIHCGIEIVVLASMRGTKDLERYCHDEFEQFHVGHEWFTPSPHLTALIDEINAKAATVVQLPDLTFVSNLKHLGGSYVDDPELARLNFPTPDQARFATHAGGAK